jgi:hypothetical protein
MWMAEYAESHYGMRHRILLFTLKSILYFGRYIGCEVHFTLNLDIFFRISTKFPANTALYPLKHALKRALWHGFGHISHGIWRCHSYGYVRGRYD